MRVIYRLAREFVRRFASLYVVHLDTPLIFADLDFNLMVIDLLPGAIL